ncbi:hypothetical protein FRC12_001277 [Ceratobasidium sp. 428]|nr:hypothetical protein FRC12_001277 [Ceratobasidium sp. 428]
MDIPPVANPPFETRNGTWEFHPPASSMTYAGQVVRWAHVSRLRLYFDFIKVGADNSPCWIAQPVLAGEELPQRFYGYETNKRKAKEDACRKMAQSGHCVSFIFA